MRNAAQQIAEIRRWHVGGDDLGDLEPDIGRWRDQNDMALIAKYGG